MKLVPIQQVAGHIKAGAPLPFGVRDAEGKLLLAKGQPVPNEQMREALLNRGVFVDMEELRDPSRRGSDEGTGGEDFFARWEALQTRLSVLLRAPQEPLFLPRVKECAALLIAWAERFPDQLLFVVIQHDHSRHEVYGLAHLLHTAAVAALLARRLAWAPERQKSLVGAALTMNLSIIDLQGRLASRGGKLAPPQRAAIDRHPDEAVAWLRNAGLEDAEWLAAVAQHHEQPGGGGYPQGLTEPDETAQLLRLVDIFLAKLASRGGRAGLPAPQAAKSLYTGSNGHPFAALLVKEVGMFPPGTLVKLASGETAVAVRRGTSGNTPIVSAVMNRHGDALGSPVRRDTAVAEYAITGLVAAQVLRVKLSPHQLYDRRYEA
ncbi:HD-GYP domain-containing protein (c-di-GMP phosphodiesterase class II) [Pelomonas saccharophila]|uniref:HD-GYP domain-containing protein (C-di-GMP phosphodiesterase class II) n=1 Tax=Roseateles saccharophilus TaxID=304 RepID=A0ABU1YI76_ROSSA|nr:HD domain-containing phosphohydrolase [Roseateles saccharophilus]MDR7268545.1 HD-GYP domain-containing protein (c-di-GMP phosphodiesterase class II) [Roseateles saccharophilus]